MSGGTDASGTLAQPSMVPGDAEAIAFVHDFVKVPSVSGNERACIELFVATAARWGFEVEIDAAGNGIATRNTAVGCLVQGTVPRHAPIPELVLLGHIDTVPGEIPVRLEDGVLHGRGSVDAKGPLAAMLVAAARAELMPGSIVRVIAAVGEETPHSAGAQHVAKSLRPSACIIGEPSGWDGVTLGYKGRLVVTIEATHASGHSAGPNASPGDAVIAFWTRCLQSVEQLNAGHSGAFDVIQATVRSMSTTSDGLQDVARLQVGFRLPQWMSPHDLESQVRRIAAEFSTLSLLFEGHESAHVTDRNDVVVRSLSNAIRAIDGKPRPKTKTGTADLNVVAPVWRCPIAAYGPGDSSLDHTPHERLEVGEYLRSIQVLERAIPAIFAEASQSSA